jgi:hypothetical protein
VILGLSTGAFTAVHVAISLIAILSGLVVAAGMLRDQVSTSWTTTFLAATIATSLTGFFFHSTAIGPPHIVGALSLVVLALAVLALYGRKLEGAWRPVYVICAVIALYLNVFVAIVQAFQKISPLHALAPNGSEPPFLAAQGFTLIAFVVLGVLAARRFRDAVPFPAH